MQRRLIAIADEVVLVATHDVLTGSSPACVAALGNVTSLITDRPVPRPLATALHGPTSRSTWPASGSGREAET